VAGERAAPARLLGDARGVSIACLANPEALSDSKCSISSDNFLGRKQKIRDEDGMGYKLEMLLRYES
jgi:hypothetical protein